MLIALVTCARLPQLTEDDRLLAAALRDGGAEARAVVWDDPAVDWTSFDAIVIRSTWDYHLRIDEFLAWLDRLEACGAKVWNPVPLLRWNADKSYLRGLDVPRVPTAFVRRGGDVIAAMREHGWHRAVVKPTVSATAFETFIMEDGQSCPSNPDAGQSCPSQFATRDVLVQPFIDEVIRDGEWSLLFFGGVYSHSVLKRAKAGDFRVQNDFGGTAEVCEPDAAIVESAARALAAAAMPTLYARVDGVVIAGVFTLMELELIEPVLFLGQHPEAAARVARQVFFAAAAVSKSEKGTHSWHAEASESPSPPPH
jgi:glutathione synthase/RimK-type ligase-like ATP-grasp enzyme